MKKLLATFIVLIQVSLMIPSAASAQSEAMGFSREQGYFIRPELYGAVLAEFGYQLNPNLQFSLGAGMEFAEQTAVPELIVGVRAYATDTKWTAFFD